MGSRSKVFLGKYVFIKYIEIEENVSERLKSSLISGDYSPFDTNEFLASYLLSEGSPELVSPGTTVIYSLNNFSFEDLNKYENKRYNDFLNSLIENNSFIKFSPDNIIESSENIKTVLILSEKLTGNFRGFLERKRKDNEVRYALIHICYLLHKLAKDYKSIHGDSKLENYTWKELEKPIEYTYDFRTENDNSSDLVFTLQINHIFYLTDLEFIHSITSFAVSSSSNDLVINFSKVYDWMSDNKSIFVPKLSAEEYYDFRNNLFEGYQQDFSIFLKRQEEDGWMYTRMFSIDLLLLIKIILTRDYTEQNNVSPNLRRKLNIYFANYCAISQREIDPQLRYKSSYQKVSPAQFAFLLK